MIGFKLLPSAVAFTALLLLLNPSLTAAQSITTTLTIAGSPTTTVIAPSPTGRGYCEFYIDHWDCDPTRTEATASATVTEAAAPSVEPSPVGQVCHLHVDHWHCDGEDHSGHDHSGHSHAGHSHGPDAVYGCGLAPLAGYDMPLHIGALLVLLASSAFGAFLPILLHARRNPSRTAGWTDQVLFICRHFGTGVLISTAFVHLLSHAMMYWANECVGELAYEATGPAIAMGAVWLVFCVDFFLLRALRRRSGAGAVCGRHHDGEQQGMDKRESTSTLEARTEESNEAHAGLTFAQAKCAEWDVIAIELGIIFHSILIGVTLGVATGSGFVALLIAITFHQLFEGLALGSRLSLLLWKRTAYKVGMASAFVLTTPLGVAIGIGVRKRFNGNGKGTLVTLGTFHALSAGILLYTALVELVGGDFIHAKQMQRSSLGRCVGAVVALTVGIVAMSVLALWA